MTDAQARDETVYCPRCFHLVADGRAFCQHCGQFIHANAPADSRPWDTRPPQFPSVDMEAFRVNHAITLPEDEFPLFADRVASEETAEPSEEEGADAGSRETDTESA